MEQSNSKERFSKPRAEKYNTKLAINGNFDDVVKAMFKNADKSKVEEPKKK